jgi:hypothetical protein
VRRALLLAVAVALGPGAGAAAADDVLVVGDSLEVGTGPYLKRELAGREVEVDARTGRPSDEGLRVLRSLLRPGHRVVVFDLGTNDDPSRPALLRASLSGALSLAGERCLVISTLRRPPLNGVPVDAMNAEIERISSAPNVRVMDWLAASATGPGLMSPDGVHATPNGYAVRARVLASEISACGERAARPGRPKPAKPRPRPTTQRPSITLSAGPLPGWIAAGVGTVTAAVRAAAAALLPRGPEPVLGAP